MSKNPRAEPGRRGAALLLLVVVLLLVIVSATHSLVTTTVASRQAEVKHVRSRIMLLAIERATALMQEQPNSIVFPVDESSNQRIEVAVDQDLAEITASWYFRSNKVSQITRPYSVPSGRSVSEAQPTLAADEK